MSKFPVSKLFIIFLLIAVGFYLFFPSISNASLVPCGLSQDDATTPNVDESQMCTLCHLVVGIKGIIDYGFTIMVFVGLVMLIISGVIYIISAGDEGMMTTAKGLMKNALIGFALILGAWLIVSTIMWVLGTRGNLGVERITGSWNTFTCVRTRQ